MVQFILFRVHLTHGLNIASVTHIEDSKQINPFWVPHWKWTSPNECPHLHIKDEHEQVTKLYIIHLFLNICTIWTNN